MVVGKLNEIWVNYMPLTQGCDDQPAAATTGVLGTELQIRSQINHSRIRPLKKAPEMLTATAATSTKYSLT